MADPKTDSKPAYTTMVLNNTIVQSVESQLTEDDGSVVDVKVALIDRNRNWQVDPKDTFVMCNGSTCATVDWPELFIDVDPDTYFTMAFYKKRFEAEMGGIKLGINSFVSMFAAYFNTRDWQQCVDESGKEFKCKTSSANSTVGQPIPPGAVGIIDHHGDGIVDQLTLVSEQPSAVRQLIISGGNVIFSNNNYTISIESVKIDDPVYKDYFKQFIQQKSPPAKPKEGPIPYKRPQVPLS
ncbi:MAG: hypothetical protein HYU98_02560 [Deltaproteobacteria bacterium]|nr:hypothetical protein [Deltaproteobacteria bacterium]